MDKISLLYENKLFGDNLVRHDVMQEFQRCVAYENYEKAESLVSCLTESERHILLDENINLYESGQITDRQYEVVSELFGGLRNIAGSVGRGLKNTAQAAGQGIQRGVQAAGQGIQRGAQAAGQKVGQVGSAIKSGAQQVGQNVQNMYQTGENERAAGKQVQELTNAYKNINAIITNIQQINPDLANFIGKDPRLSHLAKVLNQIASTAQNKATAASNTGVFGGVGNAAAQGYQRV
jgi:phage-related protein